MSTRPVLSRAAAAAGAGALTLVAVSGPAAAATGDDVSVVNTETVQAYTDASGEVESQRIYEQLHFTGTGPASVENPAVLEGLRNLDGFGGFDTKDGEQFVEVEVDGTENVRTVSDYEGDLPLDIAVSYTLDGKRVEPADLVGATGDLEVEYTVENVTGRIQTVSFDDGTGETATEDVEVSVPMVGSLTTVLPESFRDVASDQANMAGDGRGSTKMSFTMTLVPPVGADTVTFGYSAAITDAVLPRATVTALPVNPMKNPNLKTAGESYAAGAATGSELTDGASTIDSNLLLLRDGSSDLLSGSHPAPRRLRRAPGRPPGQGGPRLGEARRRRRSPQRRPPGRRCSRLGEARRRRGHARGRPGQDRRRLRQARRRLRPPGRRHR